MWSRNSAATRQSAPRTTSADSGLDALRQFPRVVLAQEEVVVIELHCVRAVFLNKMLKDGGGSLGVLNFSRLPEKVTTPQNCNCTGTRCLPDERRYVFRDK